jgi:ligand-binding sensor domain-containing protein
MKKYAHIYTLVLIFVCCTSAEGQHKTVPAKDKFPPKTKDVTTSHGPNVITRTIKQDSKGNIWLASWEGVFRYDGKSFTNVTRRVSSSRFCSVLEDSKGNFWFASVGSGVYYYDGKNFRNFTTKDGLAHNDVIDIYEDKTGNIWFGTEAGVNRYDGKSFQTLRMNEGLNNNDINSIVEDRTGKFWIGARGHAFVYDGKTVTRVTYNGEPFTNVRSIIKDRKGNIWLGGASGLWRYDGRSFTNFTPYFVGYIHEDKKGNLWTSSQIRGGSWVLSRYDEKTLSSAKPTATEINANEGKMLFGILEANDGIIWFGTGAGAYRYDGNTITDSKGQVRPPAPKSSLFWAPPK